MPAKGNGTLQKCGDAVANILNSTIPFPISNMHKSYWAFINYVTNEDYMCVEKIINKYRDVL